MNYDGYFLHALARLQDERRYRVFADLERIAGRYSHAVWHSPAGPRSVVIWCSNDYSAWNSMQFSGNSSIGTP
jgi:5-aminolevulinate synthase